MSRLMLLTKWSVFVSVCLHRLLRTAILSESVRRGDSNNVAKVKQMFSDWFKYNTRFVRIILVGSYKGGSIGGTEVMCPQN